MDAAIPVLSDEEKIKIQAKLRAHFDETHALGQRLLDAIKAQLPELENLLAEMSAHWHAEDGFYRFYHQSLKVYGLQADTGRVVAALRSLLPERDLNEWFTQIIREGTGKTWTYFGLPGNTKRYSI